ncbi:hypothetical protein C922_04178 [Plasmodium inui San Antonio 1]|uniref:AB hydrolase-1 domain-containing protein n=1 Tax=Plasmodium inui San Antonio 1 TaxID=1237626 RepID=W7A256_9APIC|nr:hypothetical protein C922_04178 [Plasmodium inui San Antonio 1]EUD65438.1 hypothetical protein C922_04178 [Plasmodium inui San Antonio 1]
MEANRDVYFREASRVATRRRDMLDDDHMDDADTKLEDKYIKNYEPPKNIKLVFFLFGLLTLCGLRSFIVSRMAFWPPKVKGYEVVDNEFVYKNHISGYDINELLEKNNVGVRYNKIVDGTDEVASIFVHRKPLDLNKQTILYSHGNNTDMGRLFPQYVNLLFQTDANIMAYDYSGYGYSNKKPTEKNMHKNIKMVYKFLTEHVHINPLNIILYGYSIGTCPSSYLLSSPDVKVGGCILQSPLASGIKLLFPFQKRYLPLFDVFKNYEKLNKAPLVPVYIMHGKRDQEIPYYHSVILLDTLRKNFENKYRKMKNVGNSPDGRLSIDSLIKFWGSAKSNHDDVELVDADKFYRRLRSFLMLCEDHNGVYPV